MSQPNKFAAALNRGASPPAETDTENATGAAVAEPPVLEVSIPKKTPKATQKPSRSKKKHVGGYFDPAVSRQLREIALNEDKSVQDLIAEAIDMVFQSRGKPTIASKPDAA